MIPSKFKSPSLFSILDRISVPFSPALSRSSLAYSTSSLDLQKSCNHLKYMLFCLALVPTRSLDPTDYDDWEYVSNDTVFKDPQEVVN